MADTDSYADADSYRSVLGVFDHARYDNEPFLSLRILAQSMFDPPGQFSSDSEALTAAKHHSDMASRGAPLEDYHGAYRDLASAFLHAQWLDLAVKNNNVLAAIAAEVAQNDGLSPVPDPPSLKALSDFLEDCPDENRKDADRRLTDLFAAESRWITEGPPVLAAEINSESKTQYGRPLDLRDVQTEWEAQEKVKHPLAPLIRAWWKSRPKRVQASSRTEGRIIPARLAMTTPQDRRAGTLFSHAAHTGRRDGNQFVLPGFQNDRQAPALPLALYDLGLGQMANSGRNPGAPLALRLFVSSILAVKQGDRHGGPPLALEVPLRQMLAWLYPGERRPRPTEYWPRLMAAAEALDSQEARVPWYDPKVDRGGLRRIVSVGDIPRGPGALDDHVRIIVDLPPGSENGPQVSNNLEKWGVTSAAAYRALLNLAYRWFTPGVTVRPVGLRADGKSQFWAQSDNPAHYERLTDAELVQTIFPTSARKSFRGLLAESHRVLAQLEKEGELRVIDGKVLPAKRSSLPPGQE